MCAYLAAAWIGLWLSLTVSARPNIPLAERETDEILREYTIIADFSQKEDSRTNSKEIFWRYPLKIPSIGFLPDFPDPKDETSLQENFPATVGSGRALQHMNRGRAFFIEGDYERARKTWLGGRARYGKTYPFHRRNDYFLAYSFFMIAKQNWLEKGHSFQDAEVRHKFVNANTFFSWAFGVKKDLYDPLLDKVAPQAYYNQAAIYFMYEKWAAAYGTVNRGLNFLRQSGRKDYRSDFRRMLAELFIRNRNYLEAIQELDLALRQEPTPELAALVFARIGDIYFDLNNFELADDMYALAIRMDRERNKIRAGQYILRGESLFWLGQFNEAQKMMDYGLRSMAALNAVEEPISTDLQALASLRIADSWLALQKLEEAKLAYFRHEQEFRNHPTANFARLRLACLELPFYDGKNILHARRLLEQLKEAGATLPAPAQEIAWTCEVASYAQHERTPEMVERVRTFYTKYPQSDFLKSLIPAVREVQAKQIDPYFAKNDLHGAILFFEKTRNFLFPSIETKLKEKLFKAYVDTLQSHKAREFYPTQTGQENELDLLRRVTMLAEVSSLKPSEPWLTYSRKLSKRLKSYSWKMKPNQESKLYVDRILATEHSEIHEEWLYQMAKGWVEADFSLACDLVHPLMQRLLNQYPKPNRYQYILEFRKFIGGQLDDLLRFETNCAYSILEFERSLYEDELSTLAQIYLNRDFVPINQMTANLYFVLAEECQKSGLIELAKRLWTLLRDKGDPNLSEVDYAKVRLDPRRTELEKLWNEAN